MDEIPESGRRRLSRSVVVVIAMVALVVTALGIGDVVRAAFEAPPPVKPYDPMPRW